ncbi:hypothetical protein ACN9MG_27620 [Burkholderia ambifaria]|jgi:hypothetical protein|uniref:hypothetical protein n=1 Tax=Burkholderia TaxID=32008 RepID=UPI00158EEB7C|nr:hypothetical protein [Burkholderia ambifaria]
MLLAAEFVHFRQIHAPVRAAALGEQQLQYGVRVEVRRTIHAKALESVRRMAGNAVPACILGNSAARSMPKYWLRLTPASIKRMTSR